MQQTDKPTFSKRAPDEWRDWSHIKDRIGEQLKAQYKAITAEELPARLVALVKKLDTKTEQEQ